MERLAAANPATATSTHVRPRCTLGWSAIWHTASRDVAPLDSSGSLTGAGSSVGTSVRLKSGRSAVRPRPCPQRLRLRFALDLSGLGQPTLLPSRTGHGQPGAQCGYPGYEQRDGEDGTAGGQP